MKYYLDTEFHEYKKKPLFGRAIDTIELISIGIVGEDDREYYAICNDFDVKAAWDNEWLRENVLKSIHKELFGKAETMFYVEFKEFKLGNFKRLLKTFAKSKAQIAEEVKDFISYKQFYDTKIADQIHGASYPLRATFEGRMDIIKSMGQLPEFYGYYSDYDWVVFCWLFGRMIDLPKGFPMYCIDLKQKLDEGIRSGWKALRLNPPVSYWEVSMDRGNSFEEVLSVLKDESGFPKEFNEHSALADARWNKKLHKFMDKVSDRSIFEIEAK